MTTKKTAARGLRANRLKPPGAKVPRTTPAQSPRSAKDMRARAEESLAKTRRDVARMPVQDVQRLVHELQVHQIELEMQNDELRRTQLGLAEASDRYSDLYDFAPVGYFSLDEQGRILEVNLTGATLLGVARAPLLRQGGIDRLIHRELR